MTTPRQRALMQFVENPPPGTERTELSGAVASFLAGWDAAVQSTETPKD